MRIRVWILGWHIPELRRALKVYVFLHVDAIVVVGLCFESGAVMDDSIHPVGVLTGRSVLAARPQHRRHDSLHQWPERRDAGTRDAKAGFDGGEVADNRYCPRYV